MKKTLSVLLAVMMLVSCCSVIAFAAGRTYSVTLPTFEGRTRAIKDLKTGSTVSGNSKTADFVISYDTAKYPNLSAIAENDTFYFGIELAEKYEPTSFTICANGTPITTKDLTGLYAVYVDKNISITIPKDAANENFALKRFTIVYKKSSVGIDRNKNSALGELFESTEGFKVYTYHPGDPQNAQTQNAVWGQDYYFKIILDEGYRKCLEQFREKVKKELAAKENPTEPVADEEETIGKTMDAKFGDLVVLSVSTTKCKCENIGFLYRDQNKKLIADLNNTKLDDVAEDSPLTLVGAIFVIDGNNVKSDMDISVKGVFTDSSYKIVSTLYRILRLILGIFEHNA